MITPDGDESDSISPSPPSVSQFPPVTGIDAQPERLATCALLFSGLATLGACLEQLRADDVPAPCSAIVDAIRRCAANEKTGPAAVQAELARTGEFHGPVRKEMETVPFAGGVPEGFREYLCAIVAARFRREAEAYGLAISEAATRSPEIDLWQMVLAGGTRLRATADRLAELRGGEL